jgi:hypothetical protein
MTYASVGYGRIYTEFMTRLDHVARFNSSRNLSLIIKDIYCHNLDLLSYIYNEFIKHESQHTKEYRLILQKGGNTMNAITPSICEDVVQRGMDNFINRNYNPMLITNIPSTRKYQSYLCESYTIDEAALPREIRMGCQAIRRDGRVEINPLFKIFIENLEAPHIYFNRLKYTCTSRYKPFSSRRMESELSKCLHDTSDKKNNKLICITMPADSGILDLRSIEDKYWSRSSIYAFIYDFIINKRYDCEYDHSILDSMTISSAINSSIYLLYNDENANKELVQIIAFVCINYYIPVLLIKKIKPISINFTCKDGIDRAGVASLCFNLIHLIETRKKIVILEDFIIALHSAPISVKGRPINHHITFISKLLHYLTYSTTRLGLNYEEREKLDKLSNYIRLRC